MQPTNRIAILAVEDNTAASALRSAAEQLFISVDLYCIGEAKDLVEILSGAPPVDMIVLSCHGKDGRIVMPELDTPLHPRQPFLGDLGPQNVRDSFELKGARVLCTGCTTGIEEMAAAFLDAGCAWYLAPTDYQDGTASFVTVVNFLYHYFVRESGAEAALARSVNDGDESGLFALHRR